MTRQLRVNWIGLTYIGLLVLILTLRATGALGAEPGVRDGADAPATTPTDAVAVVRPSFDAAMKKPLAERVPMLEQAEKQLDNALFQGHLTGKQRTDTLFYKHHVQRQLAKFPDAYVTYGDYIKSYREAGETVRGKAAFSRDLNQWKRQRDYTQTAAICEQMLKSIPDDEQIDSAALLHLADAYYHTNGTMDKCVENVTKLIEQYPKCEERPDGLRLLANAYFAKGKYKETLATLQMLKQQYPGTKWEQYADMRPAAIAEYGQGEPQKSLQIYQQTLKTYPDHIYTAYIHREMERIQKVIEQQLIQDALKGLAQNGGNPPEGPTTTGTSKKASTNQKGPESIGIGSHTVPADPSLLGFAGQP